MTKWIKIKVSFLVFKRTALSRSESANKHHQWTVVQNSWLYCYCWQLYSHTNLFCFCPVTFLQATTWDSSSFAPLCHGCHFSVYSEYLRGWYIETLLGSLRLQKSNQSTLKLRERQQSKSIRQNLIILNFAKTFFDKISLNTIASSLSTNVYHVCMDRL